jgi:hypothetical protein
MNLLNGFVPRSTALALAIALTSFSPAFARGGHGGGGHGGGGHGGGHHTGGGYHHSYHSGWSGGGSYYRGGGYVYRPRIGYGYSSGYGYYGAYPNTTYSSNYYVTPSPIVTQVPQAPYLTNQTYEPGDGYRYPLYYNPATGTYFYYPVTR